MKPVYKLIIILVLSSLACMQSTQMTATHPSNTPQVAQPAIEAIATKLPAPVNTSLPTTFPLNTTTPAPVPAEYLNLYNQLNGALNAVEGAYPSQAGAVPTFAAELSYANGNIGEGLLRPEVLALVRTQLDGLYRMGVRGVVVAIKFPMLEPNFPRSSEYLQFFKQVAAEVRQRSMKLLVESGALFSGTVFSPLAVDWSQYPSAAAFRDAEIHQLQTIGREIHPDYLQIANEPTTTAMLTKYTDTPADYADFIARAVKTIAPQPGMLLGAGAGTWENQAYVTGLNSIAGLDFIDLHVYPVGSGGGMLRLAADLSEKARSAGKRVVISEAWLYKSDTSSAYQANDFTTIIGRDVFSFWEPLDEKFIKDLTAIVRQSGIEFLSFFWVREFFAYLDYEQYHSTPLDQINPVINSISVANSNNNILSPLGQFYQNLISQQK